VQIEQLEAAHAGRAQGGLDVLLVAEHLEPAGSEEEGAGLVADAAGAECVAEDLEITRLR
jgi:hypothetical protein